MWNSCAKQQPQRLQFINWFSRSSVAFFSYFFSRFPFCLRADLPTSPTSPAFLSRVIFIFAMVRTLRETLGGVGITLAQTMATFAPPPVVWSWSALPFPSWIFQNIHCRLERAQFGLLEFIVALVMNFAASVQFIDRSAFPTKSTVAAITIVIKRIPTGSASNQLPKGSQVSPGRICTSFFFVARFC